MKEQCVGVYLAIRVKPPQSGKKGKQIKKKKKEFYLDMKMLYCQLFVISLSSLPSKGGCNQSMKSSEEGCYVRVCDFKWILWWQLKC